MPFSTGLARRGLAGLGFAVLLLGGVRTMESDVPAVVASLAGPAHLVHDFFPGDFEGERPLPQFTRLGNVIFFLGDDRETGTTVWRTDGTPGGTRRVPVAASAAGAVLSGIVGVVGERMLLTGTAAGDPTTPVLFAAGEEGEAEFLSAYRPQLRVQDEPLLPPPAILGARFYFLSCGEVRCEIWSTDGTPAGTAPLPAFADQPSSVHQEILGAFADRCLLVVSGPSLLAYDVLTGRVTTVLADWQQAEAYPVGESLYLIRNDGLYVSTLAAPRAVLLFKGPDLARIGWRGDTFYFAPPNGRLWSTDGKSVQAYQGRLPDSFYTLSGRLDALGGTVFLPVVGYYEGILFGADEEKHSLTDLHLQCSGGKVPQCPYTIRFSPVTVAGDRAFSAIEGELWVSDGTPQGTRHHRSLTRPDPATFRALDGRLLLGAASWKGEQRLWATDGTVAGTRALSDGSADRPFRVEGPPAPLGDALITAADRPPVGQQLWRIADGRTTPLTALRHIATGIYPGAAFPFGGSRVILEGGPNQSWIGVTPHGTLDFLPLDRCSSFDEPCPNTPVAVRGRLLFSSNNQLLLTASDGTREGTRTLSLENPDRSTAIVAALGPFQDRAVVLGDSGGLWTSDGTPAGTRYVTRLPPEPVSGSRGVGVGTPFAVGAVSYLFRRLPVPGDDTISTLELWRTDGTAAGTERLMSTAVEKEFDPFPNPTPIAGKIFFRVVDRLWVSDGTAVGTRELAGEFPRGTFALLAGDTRLYVGAYEEHAAAEALWAIDPATLRATKLDRAGLVGSAFPGFPLGSVVGDTLFFLTQNPGGVRRWRRTEGTPESTVLLPDFLARNTLHDFVTAGDRRYFTACDAAHGCELWQTDRLGEDTRLVQDLWVGPRSGDPEILAVAGSTLWFAGTQPDVGRELWSLEVPGAPTAAAWTRPPAPRGRLAQGTHAKRRPR